MSVAANTKPWAGLIGGFLGWAVSHQTGSDLVQYDCERGGALTIVTIGVLAMLLAGAGLWLSWTSFRGPAAFDVPGPGRLRFVAAVSSLAAAIFLLAIVFHSLSALIIPRCA